MDSLGLTWNCWIAAGYKPEITTELTTKSAIPAPGNIQERLIIFAKNKSEQTAAIQARIAFAGKTAFTSVKLNPVINLSSFNANWYRSNQYATALTRTINPSKTDNCTRAATVVFSPTLCGLIPPYK